MPKIFISHSWEDNTVSRKIAENLKRDGAEVWIDHERIKGGDSLPGRISEALEWCDTLLLLWSESATKSYYVDLEWKSALDLRKKIIPCIFDNAKIPAILRSYLYIKCNNFEDGYQQIVQALRLEIKPKEAAQKPPAKNLKSDPIISTGDTTPTNINIKPSESRNTAKFVRTKFRFTPKALSSDDVETMLKERDFFDKSKNKNARGFSNQYDARTIKGDKIVVDYASNLMWQQGGSSNHMNYDAAKKWIDELNNSGYADYKDWRLPTLEEGMSLMEPEEKNGDLYINPLFDKTQRWIWTSDLYKGGGSAWVLFFYGGGCDDGYGDSFVRAVRPG